MSGLESYQLTYPELLSEETLREILTNRCIELPVFKALSKSELIEIFKRVALPLPQRKYDETKHTGKKMLNLRAKRGIANVYEDSPIVDKCPAIESKGESCKRLNGGLQTPHVSDRLKPPVSQRETATKTICLTNSSVAKAPSSHMKRKVDERVEVPQPAGGKKRQKITWP